MSLAFPGSERKRTSEKDPATATPTPRFPFTIMMTIMTMTGRMTRVTEKERDGVPTAL